MKNIYLTLLILVAASHGSSAQLVRQLVSTNGAVLKAGDYQLSYSIGEISISRYYRLFPTLTEGFQQPHVSRTGEVLNGYVQASTYPNPTTGLVTLDIYGYKLEKFNVRVLNTLGQFVATPPFRTGNGSLTIDLTTLPAGVYIIAVSDDNFNTAVSGKIIKQHN